MKTIRVIVEVEADRSVTTEQVRREVRARLPRETETTVSMRQDGASSRVGSIYWRTVSVKQVSKS